MSEPGIEIGRVVVSKAGRDSGKVFLIYEVLDEQYVSLVDGVYHKIDRPKKKKSRHLHLKPDVITEVAKKKQNDIKMFDSEISNYLQSLGYSNKSGREDE